MSHDFDARITPARPDLAAAHLKGKVTAARFAEGRTMRAARGTVELRARPSDDSGLETQLLFGEDFTVYERREGWVWGQAARDSYVGYARADGFSAPIAPPNHRVAARLTPLLTGPDAKKPSRDLLPMNAKIAVIEDGERFVRLADGHFVFSGHIEALSAKAGDWVAIAEGFAGVPYLWGGKTVLGLDCSGLIQTSLEAGGIDAPRDTDMMEMAIGHGLALDARLARGDLVFWKGHMGAMLDAERMVHANAHFMQVTIEPFAHVRARIAAREGLAVRTIKRLTT